MREAGRDDATIGLDGHGASTRVAGRELGYHRAACAKGRVELTWCRSGGDGQRDQQGRRQYKRVRDAQPRLRNSHRDLLAMLGTTGVVPSSPVSASEDEDWDPALGRHRT